MKIVADENIPFVKEAFSDFGEVILSPGRAINRALVHDASILLVRSVTPVNEALLDDTSLKFVASATIGIEHIDRLLLEKKGVGFGFAPGSNANSVAEYVVSAIHVLAQRSKQDVSSLTLGIIGAGNIGSRLHQYAEALGMRCIINDQPLYALTNNELYRPLKDVLDESDIISLHVPLTKQGGFPTYQLVNNSFLMQMKPGASLINTSRGQVVDERALFANAERLANIVLDVWENEPTIDVPMLRKTALATPHIAGYSYDGKINGTTMIYRAACEFFGRQPSWDPSKIILDEFQIDISDIYGNPVGHALVNACPILHDDAALRKIECFDHDYFDSLRGHYQKRYEFSHYTVHYRPDQQESARILQALGFKIKRGVDE